MKIKYHFFKTPWGWVGIVKGEMGLKEVILPKKSPKGLLSYFEEHNIANVKVRPEKSKDKDLLKLSQQIKEYFRGKKIRIDANLDLTSFTNFQKKVFVAAKKIYFGKVRSYNWVAKIINHPHAVRPVGSALKKNPFPIIIPCHRVIRENGHLGGFSGGMEMKKKLLELEGRKRDNF